MAGSTSKSNNVFDVSKLRELVALMDEHDLGEIDLRDGASRVRLSKRVAAMAIAEAPANAFAAPSRAPTASAEAPPSEDHLTIIKSIMVGTFFASPNPDAPPFVKVGDHVGVASPVCIIEAMKVFNEIPAGVAGQVVAVLVESGDPVEFGQPLFKIDTRR